MILADTVGFIRHLPHDLVAAFKATLQETREANLLLHVVDCADEQMQENIESVQQVLAEIEADDRPQLMICNKIDKLGEHPVGLERDEEAPGAGLAVSPDRGRMCRPVYGPD